MVLTWVPCFDKEDCKYVSTEKYTLATTDHSSHDNDTEHCSPFCMCVCCGQSVTNIFYPIFFPNLAPLLVQELPIYTLSFASEDYFFIWQPPKIS